MKRKNIGIALVLILCAAVTNAQSLSQDLLPLKDYYHKFSAFSTDNMAYDSTMYYEQLMKDEIIAVLRNDFLVNFKQLPQLFKDGSNVTILSSKDGPLNFICWDDASGGTMRNASCIVAYALNGMYEVEDYYKEQNQIDGNFNAFIKSLDQVAGRQGSIYVVLSMFIGSTAYSEHTFETLIIDEMGINRDATYIQTNEGLKHSISYDVDFSKEIYKKAKEPILKYNEFWMTFDANKQSVIAPVILDNGFVTKKEKIYKFNGQYFVLE